MDFDFEKALAELPPCTVMVLGGQVMEVREWVLWNTTPWMTVQIRREGSEFYAAISDPEHGGGSDRGTLEAVLQVLHPDVQQHYIRLFALESPNEADIRKAGFDRYNVEIN